VRQGVVAGVLVAGGAVGGLVGGLLSKYWWDFESEEVEKYGWVIVPFYATLGAIIGLILAGLLLAVADAVYFERRRRLQR
jgi:MFS family permease